MAYVQQSWRDRPGAAAAVVAVHVAVGWALVVGLGYTKVIEAVKNPEGIFIPAVPLPPPPKPEVVPDQKVIEHPIVAPQPKLNVNPISPRIDTTPEIVPVVPVVPLALPTATPTASPRALYAPVGAAPRGNPGDWVTVNDYRSSWINRGMTGTARFRLQVGADGRVASCSITVSSGHPELDAATCALVSKRAKFDPAKDETGARVPGSYSNAVRWELPE
jgi:protein TonB